LPRPASIDLSNATKLKDVDIRLNSWSVEWIVMALRTITPKHRDLRQITIRIPYCFALLDVGINVRQNIGAAYFEQWLDLDRLLVQFWESHSIQPTVICGMRIGGEGTGDCIGCLLPEAMRRGIFDLVKCTAWRSAGPGIIW
jgi:hypothetical protein